MAVREVLVAARTARWFHAVTFVIALAGLVLQLWLAMDRPLFPGRYATPIAVWNILSYFTIWSNILVAVVAYLLARDPARQGEWFSVLRLSGLTMITVTFLVYAVVLASIWKPIGWYKVADQTLHYSVPIIVVVGYLLFGPRPYLTRAALGWSLLIPVVWLAYTLVRGPFITYADGGVTRHFYPYHFIDVDVIGYGQAFVNIVGVMLLMLLVGAAYWLLDRKLPARP
ncbi:MAG: Pr6Pr family membrane protein [Micromonosporaceae bacterium]